MTLYSRLWLINSFQSTKCLPLTVPYSEGCAWMAVPKTWQHLLSCSDDSMQTGRTRNIILGEVITAVPVYSVMFAYCNPTISVFFSHTWISLHFYKVFFSICLCGFEDLDFTIHVPSRDTVHVPGIFLMSLLKGVVSMLSCPVVVFLRLSFQQSFGQGSWLKMITSTISLKMMQ